MICPVCQKAGIRDEDRTCPQCNSDLSQLKLVTQLEFKIRKWKKKNTVLFSGFTLLILILITIIVYTKVSFNRESRFNSTMINRTDSVEYYRQKYISTLKEANDYKDSNLAKVYINYRVKKGDNLSSLALIFYDDIKLVSKIAEDNNLKNMDYISVNQILKIEIKK